MLELTQQLSFEIGQDCNLSEIHDKCPINSMDRSGDKTLTDEIIINSVVEAYTNLGFTGFVSWSFYNEPMLHIDRILGLMEKIRCAVPKSRFMLWTNGTIKSEDPRMSLFERIWLTDYAKPETKLDDRLEHYGAPNRKRCLLPFNDFLVSNTGNVHICCLDWANEIKIGNVFESSLKDLDAKRWEHTKKIAGKEMVDDTPLACMACKHKWDIGHFDEDIRSKALAEISKTLIKEVRLNLACGFMTRPGWINCDLYDPHADMKCDVSKLPFEDNYADEIYASHIIEHFHYYEGFDVLREWLRVLKPGGKLIIETPDMFASCKKFVEGTEQDRINLYGHFFAQPWLGPGQVHKMLYTETQLRWTLETCGYTNIRKVPAMRYIGNEDQNLGMEAYRKC